MINITKTRILLFVLAAFTLITSCHPGSSNQNKTSEKASAQTESAGNGNPGFDRLLAQYYNDYEKYFPVEASSNGDYRYNDSFPADFTDHYAALLNGFYTRYLDSLKAFDKEQLSVSQLTSYQVLDYDLHLRKEGLKYPALREMPINQIFSNTLVFAQMGSGQSFQPFATKKDYEDFLKRIDGFSLWCDSAIFMMKKGMADGNVLPKALVLKMIPQMKGFAGDAVQKSVFYGPIKTIPGTFDKAAKQELEKKYKDAITSKIKPAYRKLAQFLEKEYLPKSRLSSGFSSLPNGLDLYRYQLKVSTTTSINADSVFRLGMKQVSMIRQRMDSVRKATGFKGDLPSFYKSVRADKKLMPFKNDKEILDHYQEIYNTEKPFLPHYFGKLPKTRFEIRKTEDFRAASAAFGEYNAGTADGKRPGIFYTAILDPKKYSRLTMETLFLHEAIPGHHFQISLQNENIALPSFRRYYGNSAYAEGWALYAESLGPVLGQYKDPYELLGHLKDDMHRAIRLVVDAGMHAKGWTRERAIAYMLDNEPSSEQGAEAEIERYMAAPGQAVSYKIGALTIKALREKYRQQLGSAFSISAFHDAILGSGALPLEVLQSNMENWAASQKK